MKIAASPFESPVATRPLDAGERAEIDGIKIDDTVVVSAEPPPAPVEEVRPELDSATRESLKRLSDLIRSQKKAAEPEPEAVPEPEAKPNPAAVLTIGSIIVAEANRKIREAQRSRGRALYRNLARQQSLADIESALQVPAAVENELDFLGEALQDSSLDSQESKRSAGIETDSEGNIASGFMMKRVA